MRVIIGKVTCIDKGLEYHYKKVRDSRVPNNFSDH